jgi:hypothetical protein
MVISTGLIVLLMTTLMSFYNKALDWRQEATERSQHAQLARVVLDRMAREIQQAVSALPTFGTGIYGYHYGIDVNTLTLPDKGLSEVRKIQSARLPGQFDLVQVKYYVAWDDVNVDKNGEPRALGLVRRENRTFLRDIVFATEEEAAAAAESEEAAASVKEELYAPEIKFLELLYFDGARWWDKWELTGQNALPQMVRVTIGFKPGLPPDKQEVQLIDDDFLKDESELEPLQEDRYTILVRIRQADVFFGSRLSREVKAFGEGESGF